MGLIEEEGPRWAGHYFQPKRDGPVNWDMMGALSEMAGALAVVISLIYLSRQGTDTNRLARAEASRTPNSDLNMLNPSFGTNEVFRTALRRAIEGEERRAFSPDDRVLLDLYLVCRS